jgi:ketosteroid isomerase-like protein
VEEGSLEFWQWFYESPDDTGAPIEERWHPDLVVHQSPDIPDTAGTFHGYEGLREANRELTESWADIRWRPQEAHDLGGGRWLILHRPLARGRASGIELQGEIGHIVTLRDGRATQLDTYLSWTAAREAAGLG